MILTEVGEIGVHVEGHEYVLRPTLYAMSQLGDPATIVDVYAKVMGEAVGEGQQSDQFGWALAVIHACSAEDLQDVFGCLGDDLEYVSGAAAVEHIVPLARCLLKHGITGAIPPERRPSDEPEYVREFNARDHVAMAVAHLGMNEREAWSATMTGLVGALRAKFPRVESTEPGAKAPTKEEHEATEAWFDRIEAKRKARAGLH